MGIGRENKRERDMEEMREGRYLGKHAKSGASTPHTPLIILPFINYPSGFLEF